MRKLQIKYSASKIIIVLVFLASMVFVGNAVLGATLRFDESSISIPDEGSSPLSITQIRSCMWSDYCYIDEVGLALQEKNILQNS
jgi:hypothetical protein